MRDRPAPSLPIPNSGSTRVTPDGTVDLRSATTPVRTTVFKPVDHPFLVTSLSRGPSDGSGGIGVTLMNGLDAVVRVTPTRGALHGEQTLPCLLAATGHDATGEYRIGVGRDRSGRIPGTPIVWHYGPAQVVTRDNTFYGLQDPTQARFITSVRTESMGAGIAIPLSGRRLTEYFSTNPGIPLEGELVLVETDDTIKGWQTSVGRVATAGTHITETWNRAALHSRTVPRVPGQVLPATASLGSDGTVRIFDMPMSDAEPTHVGNPDLVNGQIASSYAVRDAKVIDSGPGALAFAGGSIPRGTRAISATQTATRSGAPYAYPTKLVTSFSTPLSAAIAMPRGYACATPAPCRVLPILSADYTAAVGLDNAFAKPGRQTLGIRVHQAGRTSPRGITSVAAWMTYDGTTWTKVPVTGSGGSYTAQLAVPKAAPGRTTAGLKVQVTDAAGSRLVETVTGAFGLPR